VFTTDHHLTVLAFKTKNVTLLYETIMYSNWTPRHEHYYQTVHAAVTNDDVSNHRIQFNSCDKEVIYGRYKTLSEKVKTCLTTLCPYVRLLLWRSKLQHKCITRN